MNATTPALAGGYLNNLAISLLDRWHEHHGVHFDGGPSFAVEEVLFHGRFAGFWTNMIRVARKRAV